MRSGNIYLAILVIAASTLLVGCQHDDEHRQRQIITTVIGDLIDERDKAAKQAAELATIRANQQALAKQLLSHKEAIEAILKRLDTPQD